MKQWKIETRAEKYTKSDWANTVDVLERSFLASKKLLVSKVFKWFSYSFFLILSAYTYIMTEYDKIGTVSPLHPTTLLLSSNLIVFYEIAHRILRILIRGSYCSSWNQDMTLKIVYQLKKYLDQWFLMGILI